MRIATAILLSLLTVPLFADEKLAGVAARSVHLQYPSPTTAAVYNTITVKQSAPGTYFCVLGFNRGYFGLQQLGNGKKLLIFSVWDPGSQNNPNQVEQEKRVQLLHKHPDVRTDRFGNEGTGGQSFYDFDWKLDTTYQFLVTSKIEADRTIFSGHFFHPDQNAWLHLVTFSTPTGGKPMGGFYSFVEDFRRNRVSLSHARTARFGPAWIRSNDQWTLIDKARFTADSNPATNIDAGLAEGNDGFFLSTGGDIQNTGTKLREEIKLPEGTKPKTPEVPEQAIK